MRKIEYKKYVIALIWLITGYLCWLSGIYAFSYGTANLVIPATNVIKTSSPQLLTALHFVLFHFTDVIVVILFVFCLALIFGKGKLWFVGFMICPVGFPMYGYIQDMTAYMNYYRQLPSWVTSTFFQAILAYLVVIPIMGWAGMKLGNKWYIKRRQAQQ